MLIYQRVIPINDTFYDGYTWLHSDFSDHFLNLQKLRVFLKMEELDTMVILEGFLIIQWIFFGVETMGFPNIFRLKGPLWG